ncbi:hypothetical protein [Escherichia phage UPEC01]|nr:hypothetical protein [Escherichia phage UPEC01]
MDLPDNPHTLYTFYSPLEILSITKEIEPIKNATTKEIIFSEVESIFNIKPANMLKPKVVTATRAVTFLINSQRFILFSSVVDGIIIHYPI